MRLQVGIPASMRLAMPGISAAFTLLGLFSSLVSSFFRGILGVHNLAVIGAASFLVFATAAISQALFARLASRRSVGLGLPLLLAGLAALEGSLLRPGVVAVLSGDRFRAIPAGQPLEDANSTSVPLLRETAALMSRP